VNSSKQSSELVEPVALTWLGAQGMQGESEPPGAKNLQQHRRDVVMVGAAHVMSAVCGHCFGTIYWPLAESLTPKDPAGNADQAYQLQQFADTHPGVQMAH
jgi:hypothetical protein